MSTFFKVLLVILIILVIALVVLYFVGRKMQRKQAAQQEQMEAAKQSVSMLVIDKKIMPLKQSGLPQIVIDQTPKLMRRSKLPIVKAKVGPRIMTLVADSAIFDTIPDHLGDGFSDRLGIRLHERVSPLQIQIGINEYDTVFRYEF